jgi:hypothetical protein
MREMNMVTQKLVTLIALLSTCIMTYGMMQRETEDQIFQFFRGSRAKLFEKEYISEKEIAELKKTLTTLYDKEGPAIYEDVAFSLNHYSKHRIKDTAQEIKFLDGIVPLLLAGWNTTEKVYQERLNNLFCYGRVDPKNTYLMNLLIYQYGVILPSGYCHFTDDSPLYGSAHSLIGVYANRHHKKIIWQPGNKAHSTQESIDCCKAIITPPPSLGQKLLDVCLKKDTTIITFLMCLKRLRQKNVTSFGVPKVVVNNCILTRVAQDLDSEEMGIQRACERVKKNVRDIIAEFKKEKVPESASGATAFLYNDFEAWAQEHMNPKIIMGKALIHHIQSFAQKK